MERVAGRSAEIVCPEGGTKSALLTPPTRPISADRMFPVMLRDWVQVSTAT